MRGGWSGTSSDSEECRLLVQGVSLGHMAACLGGSWELAGMGLLLVFGLLLLWVAKKNGLRNCMGLGPDKTTIKKAIKIK